MALVKGIAADQLGGEYFVNGVKVTRLSKGQEFEVEEEYARYLTNQGLMLPIEKPEVRYEVVMCGGNAKGGDAASRDLPFRDSDLRDQGQAGVAEEVSADAPGPDVSESGDADRGGRSGRSNRGRRGAG